MINQDEGNKRLLLLASILDTADQLHGQRGEPTYDQQRMTHPCGTPACALGHWAEARRDLWTIDVSLGAPLYVHRQTQTYGYVEGAVEDFALTEDDAEELFGEKGCGGAKTAMQASAYIREFVRKRQEGPCHG